MYYSCEPHALDPERPWWCWYQFDTRPAEDNDVEYQMGEDIVKLGTIDKTEYWYVKDGIKLVEQAPELNCKKLDKLPEDVALELSTNGEYAVHQRELAILELANTKPDYRSEAFWATSLVQDLGDVVLALASAMPQTMDEKGQTLTDMKGFKNLLAFHNKVNSALKKVGL